MSRRAIRVVGVATGLEKVPTWVHDMPDDEAFMALVLCNTHGELTPLERGLHALKSGMSVRAYAEKVGRAKGTVDHEIRAARVLSECPHVRTDLDHRAHSEIHAAPSWLWPALVQAAASDEWTVERVRKAVASVKDAAEPPAWVDAAILAGAIVPIVQAGWSSGSPSMPRALPSIF